MPPVFKMLDPPLHIDFVFYFSTIAATATLVSVGDLVSERGETNVPKKLSSSYSRKVGNKVHRWIQHFEKGGHGTSGPFLDMLMMLTLLVLVYK